MRNTLLALVAASGLLAFGARAQEYDRSERAAALDDLITQEVQAGRLTPEQAIELRVELHQIVRTDSGRKDRGPSELGAYDLDSRFAAIDSHLNYDLNLGRRDSADATR